MRRKDNAQNKKLKAACVHCGKEFVYYKSVSRGKFCSDDCRKAEKVFRTCKLCGKEFRAFKSITKKYCSPECYAKSREVQIARVCKTCGRTYTTEPSRNKIYCSKECTKTKRIIRNCKECGNEFTVTQYIIDIGEGHFCSRSCRNKHYLSGKGSPHWKGGISFEPYCPQFNNKIKEVVRNNFGRICFLCNIPEKENGKKLAVHHVDYNKSQGCKGKQWGLIPLCKNCHSKTNSNRWYWFNYLRDFWIYIYIDFIKCDIQNYWYYLIYFFAGWCL